MLLFKFTCECGRVPNTHTPNRVHSFHEACSGHHTLSTHLLLRSDTAPAGTRTDRIRPSQASSRFTWGKFPSTETTGWSGLARTHSVPTGRTSGLSLADREYLFSPYKIVSSFALCLGTNSYACRHICASLYVWRCGCFSTCFAQKVSQCCVKTGSMWLSTIVPALAM